jgi:hypothetical protein
VNYLMRGVMLAPGVHRVRYTYAPGSLAAGIRISAGSAVLALLIAGFGVWRRIADRRSRGKGAPPHPDGASVAGVSA